MKSWKATPKKQCGKCGIVYDKDWLGVDKFCPACFAPEYRQHTIKASDSKPRKFTPITDVQRRIMVAECRLKELSCLRTKHECTPLMSRGPNSKGMNAEVMGETHHEGIRNRHMNDLMMLETYQNEIVQTTLYLSELKVKLKHLVEQTESRATIIYPQEDKACAT